MRGHLVRLAEVGRPTINWAAPFYGLSLGTEEEAWVGFSVSTSTSLSASSL